MWPQSCPPKGMQSLIHKSPARWCAWSAFLLTLSLGPNARAAGDLIVAGGSRDLAFARYVATQEQRDAFAKAQPVGIVIEASLPGLYKSAAMLAVRTRTANQRSELQVLQFSGDGTVAQEVIDRYFTVRRQLEDAAASRTTITPANYKFHFAGEVKTGGGVAYIYHIKPKKKQQGSMAGQIWMDSATGDEVMLTGELLNTSLMGKRVDIVRETQPVNSFLKARITHVAFTLPRLGRAELVITEVVTNDESGSPSNLITSVPSSASQNPSWQ